MGNAVTVVGTPERAKAPETKAAPEGTRATAPPRPAAPAKQPGEREAWLDSAPPAKHHTLIFYLLLAVALFIGWIKSGEEHLVPESGTGYALGIVGGAMMLALLLYPVRKKARFMRNWGALKHWFRAHMLLGIIGPALVVFHSNFELGSLNSRITLFTTLLVAGSGLVGRYIYTKVHYGLYGRQMTLKELVRDLDVKKSSLASMLGYAPSLQKRLLAFDDAALKPRYGLLSSLVHYIATCVRAIWTRISLSVGLRRALKVAALREGWTELERKRRATASRLHIRAHITSAIRAAEFSVYERLMALWHVFHFPLFIMLVIVAVVHVLAVHMY